MLLKLIKKLFRSNSIAYLGDYNLRLLLVFQSPSQLRAEYGADTALTLETNAAVRILYAQKEEKIAPEIADELGTQTVATHSHSQRQGGFRPAASAQATTTTSETRRSLLLPQEIKALRPDKAILLVENLPPILARKLVYYRDRVFQWRLRPPAPVPVIAIPCPSVRGATAPALRLNYGEFRIPKDRPLASADVQALAVQWLQAAYAQAPPESPGC